MAVYIIYYTMYSVMIGVARIFAAGGGTHQRCFTFGW